MCVGMPRITSSDDADVSSLRDEDLADVLERFEVERRRRDAAEAGVLAEVHRRLERDGGRPGDLKCRLVASHRVSGRQAARREAVAAAWQSIPGVAAALAAGTITHDHAVALARAATTHPEAFVVAEAGLVASAERVGADRLTAIVSRWIRANDPDGGDGRAANAKRAQRVDRCDTDPDMVTIRVLLPNLEGTMVWAAIEARARQLWRRQNPFADEASFDAAADAPTVGNLRARALFDLVCGEAQGSGAVATQVIVTATLADIDSGAGGETLGARQISGADLARLMCTSPIAGLIFGARGEALWLGKRIRLASSAQRSAVAVRDRHCTFPGCDQHADRCEVHHLVEHANGGPTNIDNLALLCVRHHHTVHDHGWSWSGAAGPTLRWKPPAGRAGTGATRAPPVAA